MNLSFLLLGLLPFFSLPADITPENRTLLQGRVRAMIENNSNIPPFGMQHLYVVESLVKIGPPKDIFEGCQFTSGLKKLVKSGNAMLLKSFVDAGYSLPQCTASDFQNNALETAQLFRAKNITEEEYGPRTLSMRQARLDETKFTRLIEELIAAGLISGSDFENLLKDGICLNWKSIKGRNWLHHALAYGQPEVALVAFDHGLRLPKYLRDTNAGRFEYHNLNYTQTLNEVAKISGPKDRIRLIQEASLSDDSPFRLLPKELQRHMTAFAHSIDHSQGSAIEREVFEQ